MVKLDRSPGIACGDQSAYGGDLIGVGSQSQPREVLD